MHPDQLDGELMLAPGFPTPPNMDYQVGQILDLNNYPTKMASIKMCRFITFKKCSPLSIDPCIEFDSFDII